MQNESNNNLPYLRAMRYGSVHATTSLLPSVLMHLVGIFSKRSRVRPGRLLADLIKCTLNVLAIYTRNVFTLTRQGRRKRGKGVFGASPGLKKLLLPEIRRQLQCENEWKSITKTTYHRHRKFHTEYSWESEIRILFFWCSPPYSVWKIRWRWYVFFMISLHSFSCYGW